MKLNNVPQAFTELLKITNTTDESSDLWDSNQLLYVNIALSKVLPRRQLPFLISIPHSFRQTARICLFCKDKTTEEQQEYLKGLDSRIERIITVSEVRNLYKTYEQRRSLRDEFDRFLCDNDVFGILTKLLGKVFIKANKIPVTVSIPLGDDARAQSAVQKAIDGVDLKLGGGPCLSLPVGNNQMEILHLRENLAAICKYVTTKFGEDMIQRICLKTKDSPALPVYSCLPE
ncbi:hypothetical protein P9112_008036 [Eukaryota sp. TZLM1-RC]